MTVDGGFWINQLVQVGSLATVAYLSGLLAGADVKVAYTRKISFFAIFLLPLVIAPAFPYEGTAFTKVVRIVIGIGMFSLLIRPIRARVPVLATMFRSFDRPEDRPHTLLWLSTQIMGGYVVMIPMSLLFAAKGMSGLMFLPVLIHGIGDGLAEPVGVRWGRHKYRVRALFGGERRYTRSYEGSACVLLAGLAGVLLFHGSFTGPQLIGALLVVPLACTVAEARSPHTWDTPFMFLAGTVSLLAVKAWL
jgi:phytol kinase